MAPPTFAGLSGNRLSWAISTVATTGFLLFGYDQGVMSGIIAAPAFNEYFPETYGKTMQGLVTAIYEIGCLAGAMFILATGDLLGRRKAMILGGFIMILGVIIQITCVKGHSQLAQLIVGRIITGVGNGINTSTIPTYQAECSKTTNRGLLICIEGGVIAFGTLIAYWIDFGASYGSDDLVWRFPIAFQVLFGLVLCLCMPFLPESPRWLLTHERYEEAEKTLAAIRGYEIDSPETKTERDTILDSIRSSGLISGQKSTPIKALFTGGKTQHLRRLLLGSGSQFMQQVGGCNSVIYYFPILFRTSLNTSENTSLLIGGVFMIVYSIFATGSWFLIERVGRRRLLLWGTAGQMSSMILTFACLIPGTESASKGAAVGLFLYIAAFGATWLPLPWLYPAEINPIKTRGKANAVSTCTNWLFNFLIVMVVPDMIDKISWGTYLFFACTNACFFPIIYFFYPETANRSLEEIDIIFAKGFVENISYVKAAKNLPFLSQAEVEAEAVRLGLVDGASRGAIDEKAPADDSGETTIRETDSGSEKGRSERDEN
ncbi:general substrate transporter [Dactylonectria estremocensis]|uniref:General substrate transporter n=1 Tax=Dactylonectria estremocensis TaxID=1079267 RepID=A0A9P9IXV3_9HYPO|nr:general substrate transporter [Dactylonectria estremocensis]